MASHENESGAAHWVTRGDLLELKDDLRREIRLTLLLGVAAGNVTAAFLAQYLVSKQVPAPVTAALHFLF